MNIKGQRRSIEVDIARGIVILLVLIGHLPSATSITYKWIFSFHMPFFFLIAGFFSGLALDSDRNNNFLKYLIKCMRRYLIPSLVFRIFLVVTGIAPADTFRSALVMILTSPSLEWFCPALFLASIGLWIYVKTEKIVCKKDFEIGSSASIMVSCLIICSTTYFVYKYIMRGLHGNLQSPFMLDSALIAFSFLLIGMWGKRIYNKHVILIKFADSLKKWMLLGSVLLILGYYNTYVNVYDAQWGISDSFFFYSAVFWSCFVIIISKKSCEYCINRNFKAGETFLKFLQLFGRNSLSLYFGHNFTYYFITKLLFAFTGKGYQTMTPEFPVKMMILYFCISIIVLTPIVYVVDKVKQLLKNKVSVK